MSKMKEYLLDQYEREGKIMNKYQITLEIESESDPREWIWGDTLIIDENYQVVEVKEVTNA